MKINMSVKLILYFLILPLTIWAIECLNIERFFKKNRIIQIQVLYFLISMALSYLVVNFCYDVFISSKII